MKNEYTPTTDEVRHAYAQNYVRRFEYHEAGVWEFDRWLAAHDAEVAAKALNAAADELPRIEGTQITRQQGAAHWLRDRAEAIS